MSTMSSLNSCSSVNPNKLPLIFFILTVILQKKGRMYLGVDSGLVSNLSRLFSPSLLTIQSARAYLSCTYYVLLTVTLDSSTRQTDRQTDRRTDKRTDGLPSQKWHIGVIVGGGVHSFSSFLALTCYLLDTRSK